MKRQGSTPAKTAGKLSDAILATRYLDLQRLRDEVRKAEARFASASLRKASISRSPRSSRWVRTPAFRSARISTSPATHLPTLHRTSG